MDEAFWQNEKKLVAACAAPVMCTNRTVLSKLMDLILQWRQVPFTCKIIFRNNKLYDNIAFSKKPLKQYLKERAIISTTGTVQKNCLQMTEIELWRRTKQPQIESRKQKLAFNLLKSWKM